MTSTNSTGDVHELDAPVYFLLVSAIIGIFLKVKPGEMLLQELRAVNIRGVLRSSSATVYPKQIPIIPALMDHCKTHSICI